MVIMTNIILEFKLTIEERMMTLWRKKKKSRENLQQLRLNQMPMTLLNKLTQPLFLHQKLCLKLHKQQLQGDLSKKKNSREHSTQWMVSFIKMTEEDTEWMATKSAVSTTATFKLHKDITNTTKNLTQWITLPFKPKVLLLTSPNRRTRPNS